MSFPWPACYGQGPKLINFLVPVIAQQLCLHFSLEIKMKAFNSNSQFIIFLF